MAGLAALALVLAGCGDTLESFGGPTMGSTYSVKYVRGASAPDVQTAKAAVEAILAEVDLSLIHISEPTRQAEISYAVFCLKKKKKHQHNRHNAA